MRNHRVALSIAFVAAVTTPAWSAPDDVIAKCSVTINGKTYIPKEKFVALARNLTRSLLEKYDDECKGYLTKAQLAAARGEERDRLLDLKGMAPPGQPGIPVETARIELKKEEEFQPPFLVRDAYHIHSLARGPIARDDAEGASLSYTRDFRDKNDIFAGTASIIGWNVFSVDSKKTAVLVPPGFTRSLLSPGVEFDQQRNRKDPTKNIDYIGFRFIGELEREGEVLTHAFRYSVI